MFAGKYTTWLIANHMFCLKYLRQVISDTNKLIIHRIPYQLILANQLAGNWQTEFLRPR